MPRYPIQLALAGIVKVSDWAYGAVCSYAIPSSIYHFFDLFFSNSILFLYAHTPLSFPIFTDPLIMASPQSKKPPPPPSKLRRALTSLPFLLLAMFGGYLMDIPSLMRAPPPFQNGKMSFRDTSVTIPERFHLLPIFDNIFRDITHGFAPATFEIDGVSWWQSFVFLTDAGVVFLIWWMESSRAMMKGTLVY